MNILHASSKLNIFLIRYWAALFHLALFANGGQKIAHKS